jgi:putative endonuclease
MSKKWYFYVLSCSDKSFYTGVTTDIKRRLKEHNLKKGAKYTRSRTPVFILYSREMKNRSTAQKLESAFKKLTRENKLKKMVEMVEEDFYKNSLS